MGPLGATTGNKSHDQQQKSLCNFIGLQYCKENKHEQINFS